MWRVTDTRVHVARDRHTSPGRPLARSLTRTTTMLLLLLLLLGVECCCSSCPCFFVPSSTTGSFTHIICLSSGRSNASRPAPPYFSRSNAIPEIIAIIVNIISSSSTSRFTSDSSACSCHSFSPCSPASSASRSHSCLFSLQHPDCTHISRHRCLAGAPLQHGRGRHGGLQSKGRLC